MKVYLKLACVLCIGALWRTTANMAFCYLFWMTTLAWAVRYIVRAKVKGGLFVLLGITCNALVTSLNKGVMPSVGMPATFQPAAPIWNVSGKGQWLTLADQAALYRFSIGDMFLIAGSLMFLISTVHRRFVVAPIKEGEPSIHSRYVVGTPEGQAWPDQEVTRHQLRL
ncbi:MAG TPA: hypothetical protein VNZ03_34280 [Terriglobales bacterium]|nr:hypothetical protein [Terriglobales bacterium]